jgi:hypothetical protein
MFQRADSPSAMNSSFEVAIRWATDSKVQDSSSMIPHPINWAIAPPEAETCTREIYYFLKQEFSALPKVVAFSLIGETAAPHSLSFGA